VNEFVVVPLLSRGTVLIVSILAALAIWLTTRWFLRVWEQEKVSLENRTTEADAECVGVAQNPSL
jgi:hypothetical protein